MRENLTNSVRAPFLVLIQNYFSTKKTGMNPVFDELLFAPSEN